MRAIDVIERKRNGCELSAEEISFLVRNYAVGGIPDYQMSAWLMAVLWRGLSEAETFALTGAMLASGGTLDLSGIASPSVDKHSTGGVGDKTSIAMAPTLAAGGVVVPKMSGRGLGHTGGTLDKLESIPGLRTDLSVREIMAQLTRIGVCLCGQTEDLVPADRQMYALRDATATVDSLPLIAASIMSKKLAGGSRSIVIDVKVGSGAFAKTSEDARALASLMVRIGNHYGRRVVAVLTDMNSPLGYNIGNSVEIREVAALLRHPSMADARLRDLVLHLCAVGFVLAEKVASLNEGRDLADRLMTGGQAFDMLLSMVEAQGGDPEYLRRTVKLPRARMLHDIRAPRSGYVHAVDASAIGMAAMQLGAGRTVKEAAVDHSAGIVLRKTVGHSVARDAILATLHCSNDVAAREVSKQVQGAFVIDDEPAGPAALVYETIGLDENPAGRRVH
ncbi:MAG: thymidine phosphorylase [Capsulimonadaceae bacterium]